MSKITSKLAQAVTPGEYK